MSGIQSIFVLTAFLALLTALGTVLARNLVHAALLLFGFFFTIACLYVLLEVEFLAAMQVLVYIGAVSILLLFGIMLTRNIEGRQDDQPSWIRKIPAALVALSVFGLIATAIHQHRGLGNKPAWTAVNQRPGGVNPVVDGPNASLASRISNMPAEIGRELMTSHLIAFELAGLLLTAAVVGAIVLARRDRHEPESTREEPVDAHDPVSTIAQS